MKSSIGKITVKEIITGVLYEFKDDSAHYIVLATDKQGRNNDCFTGVVVYTDTANAILGEISDTFNRIYFHEFKGEINLTQ